jgi:hypothetical protein
LDNAPTARVILCLQEYKESDKLALDSEGKKRKEQTIYGH